MQQEPTDTITLPGAEPAEGPPDGRLPGADVPAPQPDPADELPERPGDHLPEVEVPTGQM